jgi:GTP1/Obg family GTP-binding protein
MTNSELSDWIRNTLKIRLSDVQNDDEIIEGIARDYCVRLGFDPQEVMTRGKGKKKETCTRATTYEPMVRGMLLMLRSIQHILDEGAK